MATTSRLSLRYPVASDTADVPRDIGNLASDIDNAAIFSKGTFSLRPTSTVGSPGIAGRYYFATDTSRLYLDIGTSWVEVASGATSVTNTMLASDAVTESKLDATFAQQLGVTNRASSTYAGPSSTQSSTGVDTGASLTLTVAASSVTVLYVSAETKTGNATGAVGNYRIQIGTGTSIYAPSYGNTSRSSIFSTEQNSTYRRYVTVLPIASAVSGTGSKEFRIQYANLNGNTQDIYIQNVYMYGINFSAA